MTIYDPDEDSDLKRIWTYRKIFKILRSSLVNNIVTCPQIVVYNLCRRRVEDFETLQEEDDRRLLACAKWESGSTFRSSPQSLQSQNPNGRTTKSKFL